MRAVGQGLEFVFLDRINGISGLTGLVREGGLLEGGGEFLTGLTGFAGLTGLLFDDCFSGGLGGGDGQEGEWGAVASSDTRRYGGWAWTGRADFLDEKRTGQAWMCAS